MEQRHPLKLPVGVEARVLKLVEDLPPERDAGRQASDVDGLSPGVGGQVLERVSDAIRVLVVRERERFSARKIISRAHDSGHPREFSCRDKASQKG